MNNTTDYLLFGRSLPDTTLTLDILLHGLSPPVWVLRMIHLLRDTPGVALRRILVIEHDANSACVGTWLFAAYHRMSVRACTLFQPITLDAIRKLGVESVQCGTGWQSLPEGDPPDVLLSLAGQPHPENCAGLARKCVWSLILGDPEKSYSTVPYFRETAGDSSTLPVCLVQHSIRWDRGRILSRLRSRKYQSLYYLRAAEEALQSIGSIVARQVHDLLLGSPAIRDGTVQPEKEIDLTRWQGAPSTTDLLRYLSDRVRDELIKHTVHRRRRRQWFVAWRDRPSAFTVNRNSFMPHGFQDFAGRPGLGYADPFPFEWQGRQLMFMEEILPSGRGRLVVTEIAAGREPATPPTVILDKPYHVSYPFVFDHAGEIYLIPETCQNRTVELYRAIHFPEKWELQKVLVERLRLVDTTPFYYGGVWYFFVTTAEVGVIPRESHLFYADRLEGAWISHPANPISSDARRLRSAGRLFWRNGRLLRPVQDCSLDYGLAVRLMEVRALSPEKYSETEVEVIDARWHPRAICTHTLNSSAGLEAIDGQLWVTPS